MFVQSLGINAVNSLRHVFCWLKGGYSSSWGIPTSQLWDVTCHMGSHSVTCHPTQMNTPHLTPAIQAGTRFSYPGGMEGWVDLVDLIAPWPWVEPATFWSRVRGPTNAAPRQLVRRQYWCRLCTLYSLVYICLCYTLQTDGWLMFLNDNPDMWCVLDVSLTAI